MDTLTGGPVEPKIERTDNEGRRFHPCEDCGGKGFVGTIPELPCETCDGEGEWFE